MPPLNNADRAKWAAEAAGSLPDGLAAYDPQLRFLWVNGAAEVLLGVKECELAGRTQWEVFPAMLGTAVEAGYRRAMAQRETVTLEHYFELSGKRCEIRVSPRSDGGLTAQLRDITQSRSGEDPVEELRGRMARLLAEKTAQLAAAHAQALQEKNRLQALMEALPVGVSLVDAEGGNLQANAEFERIWGSPRPIPSSVSEYAACQAWWADSGRPVQPEEWASAQAVRKGEAVAGQELEIERFGGQRAYVLNSAAPIRDPQGGIAGSAVAILDITERKRAEQALRDSEERLRLASSAAELGVFDWDAASDQWHWLNDRMYEIFGRTREQGPFGRAEFYAGVIEPQDREGFERALSEAMQPDRLFHRVCRIRRPSDGQRRWIEFSGRFELGPDGAARRLAGVAADISERKRAEEALRESEERLRRIGRAGRIGLYEWNLSQDTAYWSPETYELFGADPSSPANYQSWFGGIHPDDRQRARRELAELLKQTCAQPPESAPLLEFRVLHGDGTVLWLEASSGFYVEGGDLLLRGAVRDVTERKRAERAWRESEERLRYCLQASSAGTWDWDIRSGALMWSPENCRLYDLEPADGPLDYSLWESRVHPEDRARVNQLVRDVLEGKAPEFRAEFRVVTRQGEARWLLGLGRVERAADGSPLRLSGINVEITERKRAELELGVSERRFRRVFENAATGIAITDWQGRLQQCNPGFCALLGYSEEELRGMGFASLIHPEDREANLAEVGRLQAGEVPFFEIENRYVHKDGQPVWVRKFVSVLPDAGGRPAHMMALVTDVTARRRAEETLRHNEQRLRWALQGSGGGAWDWDLAGGEAWWSPEMYELWGVPAGTRMRLENSLAAVHEADRERLRRAVQESIAGRQDFHCEFRIRHPERGERWMASHGRLLDDGAGGGARLLGVSLDITERKRAEGALRESENQLRLITDAAPALIAYVDGGLRYRMANLGYERWFGVSREQVLGRHASEILGEEAWERARPYVERALAGETVNYELEIPYRAGTRWVHATYTPDRTDEGGVRGIFVLVRDIGEARQADERIRHHNAVLEGINRIFREGLASGTEEALGRRCLAVAQELTGSELGLVGEIGAGGCFDALAVSGPGCQTGGGQMQAGSAKLPAGMPIHGLHGKVLREGRGFYTNDPARHPDRVGTPPGHPPLKAFLGVPLQHEGRTFGLLAVANRPGGYRPLDQEALEALAPAVVQVFMRQRAERAVRRSREDLNRAQAVAHAGSWRLDVRRNELSWSSENHRIFGIPEGTPLSYETFLGVVHLEDREYVDRAWKAGLAGAPYDIEHRIVVDGAVRWVRERAELEFDDEGSLLGGFGTTQDITERKLIEEERAEQARLKDEFLALLGHELRNPLAAISTAVHLVGNGVSEERRQSLDEMVGRQVAVLQRLVDDLLDLARISHGHIELCQERVDLSHALQKAAAAASSPVAGRGQELVLRLPSERVLFLADGVRLEQIVGNLLNNASKYTGAGGRIELSGAREGAEVVIRCRDNGRGIPPEMQKVIFEPFTRVKMAGESPEAGVGIGLALVRRLVELHGGAVAVASAGAGKGSEFVVRLPLVEPPVEAPPLGGAEPGPRARRKLSLALVEDNPDVAQSLAIGLEQAGHRVRRFSDGPSALAGLTRLKPDAILLDIGLPGMDGYELAARLKRQPNLQSAVFIAISGFKRAEEGGKARGEFDHYFVKPVHPATLLAVLETPPAAKKAGRLRVLLVEDNAELAALTAEMLEREGFEVRSALTGRQALEAAREFRPQLTLCDLHLPDMPGPELVRELRSGPGAIGTHLVILTALPDSLVGALSREARRMGVDRVLSKPLTREKLDAVLAKLRRTRR